MMSAVLANEPHSSTHVLLGNSTRRDALLGQEVQKLVNDNPRRATLRHVLSRGSSSRDFPVWRRGRINRDALDALFAEQPPYAQDVRYLICGPGSMNRDIRDALMSLDAPSSRIFAESFGAQKAEDSSFRSAASTLHVKNGAKTQTVDVKPGETLLKAMRRAQLDPPFSCESGVCGACRASVLEGDVHMKANMALDDGEVARGEILPCQALAKTPSVRLTYKK